jgi:two-component system, chemotaxis family, sensor kinase CheA
MDLSRYAALFLTESREHLRACNQALLEWERDPAAVEPVDGLFRAIHTIKGMAATMGYDTVAHVAHSAENLLDALRTGRVTVTPGVLQLLFGAVDQIASGVESAGAGTPDSGENTELLVALDRAAGGSTIGAATAEFAVHQILPAGRAVSVAIRPDAPMRGGRAMLVLRRAEALGAVTALRPAAAAFEREGFDGRFTFRLESAASDESVVAAIISAGDVASVTFDESVPERAEPVVRARQIRVDLRRLDAMMKQVGELVVARNRLVDLAVRRNDPELEATAERIARLVGGLQTEVIQSRMTPVGEVFERFPRLVRDLGRDLGKQVRFEMEGDEIELDRAILDEIGDPLLHLIRNAMDHGLETPEVRVAAGKPAQGRLLLSAGRERNSVAIRVSDDGRGINRAAILAKAQREGVVDPAVETLTDDVLLKVLARPGFSTAHAVSGLSGRGVGVDVVATRVRALGGTLAIQTVEGKGTTFVVHLPLTLAIVRALLTSIGGERYAVPLAYVAETVEFDARSVTAVRDRETLIVRDHAIPTVHLRDLVSLQAGAAPKHRPTVILEVGDRRAALVVDALLGQQDIVVEPFDAPRGMPSFFGGATILADGAPALILDAAALL